MTIKVSRPGKLFIAGEYSVVESGRAALVTSIDRFISVEISKAKSSSIKSFGDKILTFKRSQNGLIFDSLDPIWAYITSAIRISEAYLSKLLEKFDEYEIIVTSQMDDETGKKYGLGSSASVTVAIIDAIFTYYKIPISDEILFKLSALATLENSPNNSCGDIAAIAFTGLVYYRKFDKDLVLSKKAKMSIFDLVNEKWPRLKIRRLEFPGKWSFLVGWTQKPASSFDLVKKVKISSENEFLYQDFQDLSDQIVGNLSCAIEEENFEDFKTYMEEARKNLIAFSKIFISGIETSELRNLSDLAKGLGYASKFSGAGGGDCGIAIGPSNQKDQALIDSWQKNNIKYLDIKLYKGENNV